MFMQIAVVSSILVIAIAAKSSQSINLCSEQSLNLNEYISTKIESAKPYLVDGLPELFIPSLKHIHIPYSYVNQSNFEFGVWNYDITGLENFNVLKVEADLKNNFFKFQIEFPYGEGNGSYGCKGNLFNLNFDGTGPIRVNGTNLIVNLELQTKVVQRNGNSYFEQERMNVNARIHGAFHMDLKNLYSGNTKISEIINLIFNDNSYYMFELLAPILENHFHKLLSKTVDHFFQTYTYEEIIP